MIENIDAGYDQVNVYRKPIVALMSTGDELVDLHSGANGEERSRLGDERQFKGIWDCNRPSLQAALTALGYDVVDLGVVKDT